MKYLLLTESEWDLCEQQACAKFSLPDANARRYARKTLVTNSNNSNYGKFIFPVATVGKWKCDDLFPDAISEDDNWNDPNNSPG